MRKRTSSTGRFQVSVEKAYTVSQRTPSSSAPLTTSHNASSPAACPWSSAAHDAAPTGRSRPSRSRRAPGSWTDRCRLASRKGESCSQRVDSTATSRARSGSGPGPGHACRERGPHRADAAPVASGPHDSGRRNAGHRARHRRTPERRRPPRERAMVTAVAEAIAARRHLVIQAPTGVGKSLGYLVPAVLSGATVVVTTATKALQDQLAQKDLPFLAEHIGQEMEFAVLKGRSNYLCLQRLREVQSTDRRPARARGPHADDEGRDQAPGDVGRIEQDRRHGRARWAPTDRAWQSVSVSSEECPGAQRCPMGGSCFAEAARNRAAAADIIVVNTHLYGLNVASGGVLLPEHDVVIIDEAHQLEDVMSTPSGCRSAAVGFEGGSSLTPSRRGSRTRRRHRRCRCPRSRHPLAPPRRAAVETAAAHGRRSADRRPPRARRRARRAPAHRHQRRGCEATGAAGGPLTGRLVEHIDTALSYGERSVAFVAGTPDVPRLRSHRSTSVRSSTPVSGRSARRS